MRHVIGEYNGAHVNDCDGEVNGGERLCLQNTNVRLTEMRKLMGVNLAEKRV